MALGWPTVAAIAAAAMLLVIFRGGPFLVVEESDWDAAEEDTGRRKGVGMLASLKRIIRNAQERARMRRLGVVFDHFEAQLVELGEPDLASIVRILWQMRAQGRDLVDVERAIVEQSLRATRREGKPWT